MGTTLIYVLCTLAIFNVGYALLLSLTTTALPQRTGAFFRAVWLLPRMSPSVVYALLWTWVVAPTDYGLLNQALAGLGLPPLDLKSDAPMLLIILANGFIGASFGMIIFTERDPLDPASICSTPRGSTAPASSRSSATSRCRRSAGSSASSPSTRRSRCWSASNTSG